MITVEQVAAKLNGNEYGNEGGDSLWKQCKAAGIVVVFGYSDDNMEFRGAIYDEIGCWDGGEVKLTHDGIVCNKCDNDRCPNFKPPKGAKKITAVWCPTTPACSWIYKTSIPHATFDIMEDGELYCRGIVFRLEDAKP